MKILLDIDGVMVTVPGWKRLEVLDDDFSAFNMNAVINLNRMLSATNATIVLTTSHKSNYSIEAWLNIFKKRGIHLAHLERLPENICHLNRKEEILNWVQSSDETEFVIIDDDKSLNDLPSGIKSKFILTQTMIGLDEESTAAAIRVLKKLTH